MNLVNTLLLYFVILSVFLKFSTPGQNVEFHIHRSHMEIGLFEEIKFCTRKFIKENTPQVFMQNDSFVSGCGDIFPKKC